MCIARTVAALAFWLLALLAVLPAAVELYPLVVTISGDVLNPAAAIHSSGGDSEALASAAPWLIIAALFAGNGTLLGIWNTLTKL